MQNTAKSMFKQSFLQTSRIPKLKDIAHGGQSKVISSVTFTIDLNATIEASHNI